MKRPGKSSLAITAATALFAFAIPAQATLVIYNLDFSRTGRSVNYPSPDFGYLVVDDDTGSVSSVVVLFDREADEQYYTTSLFTGQRFDVTHASDGQLNQVIAGTSGEGTGIVALQISGKTGSRTNLGGGDRGSIAKNLNGFLLLSAPDETVVVVEETPTPSPTPGPTPGPSPIPTPTPEEVTEEIAGFVGAATVKANFSEGLTQSFNGEDYSVEEAVADLAARLEEDGYSVEGGEPEPVPSPSPSPSPSPTPLPTPEIVI